METSTNIKSKKEGKNKTKPSMPGKDIPSSAFINTNNLSPFSGFLSFIYLKYYIIQSKIYKLKLIFAVISSCTTDFRQSETI